MLAIRMQRTGRKGHAQFRVIVQDARRTPTSGRVVASLGHYDPHTKVTTLDQEKVTYYLQNGAQPSDRVVRLLQAEGVTLPAWVKVATVKAGDTRHPEKLRRNRPAEESAPVAEETPEAEAPVATESNETPEVSEEKEAPVAETEAAAEEEATPEK